MRMLDGLLEREVTRDDPDWAVAMASLNISEKVRIKPSRRQNKESERDFRTVVQQLVSSILQSVSMRTSYKQEEQEVRTQRKTVNFGNPNRKWVEVEQNLEQQSLSGEKELEEKWRVIEQNLEQESLSGESGVEGIGRDEEQDLEDKILSGEFRRMSRTYKSYVADSPVDNNSRISEIDTYADRN